MIILEAHSLAVCINPLFFSSDVISIDVERSSSQSSSHVV